jgi:hypothetical protein
VLDAIQGPAWLRERANLASWHGKETGGLGFLDGDVDMPTQASSIRAKALSSEPESTMAIHI